jgi:UDP-N-acetylglucosamine transferase subunit ALG13
MAQAAKGKLLRKYRILVAPLDWGLGHATRCIPIIKELLANDCEVWLAGEGVQESLLRSEFPGLPFVSLRGYHVKYSKSGTGFLWKMIQQIPKLISSVGAEHRWLNKTVADYDFDAIISDNRFGLYHRQVPSVFITHQLSIKSMLGKWSEKVLQRWNYKYIHRFTECWVPDMPGENNLAGELSHPLIKPRIPLKYIGLLSRFENDFANSFTLPFSDEGNNHLLFILSGPEPQRSILEDKIVNEVSHYSHTATIVRGLPLSLSVIPSTGMIKFYNHLPALELSEEIAKAEWVISRSGYSTVMDLVKTKKKSILIPTPGQTEQEYLARHLHQNHVALSIHQNNFFLESAIESAKNFKYHFPVMSGQDQIKAAVHGFLKGLKYPAFKTL